MRFRPGPNMTPRDHVVLVVVYVVALFLALSMVGQVVLIVSGDLDGDDGIWRPMFDLVAVLVGAIGGYVARDAMGSRDDDT